MSALDQEQLGELLSAYVDGEVTPVEKALVERLLREDEGVRRRLDEMRRTVHWVQGLPRHAAPGSIAENIDGLIQRAELLGDVPRARGQGAHPRWWARRLAVAAVVGLAVWGGWWSYQSAFWGARDRAGKVVVDSSARKDAPLAKPEVDSFGERTAARSEASRPGPTFVERWNAGEDVSSLRKHEFANEPVRIQLTARDAQERDRLLSQVEKRLQSENVVELAALGESRGRRDEVPPSVYVKGSPGTNFLDASQQQLLVNALPEQIDRVLDEVQKTAAQPESVELAIANKKTRGIANSRSELQQFNQVIQPIAPPSVPAAESKDEKAEVVGDEKRSSYFVGLFRAFGLEEALKPPEATTARQGQGPMNADLPSTLPGPQYVEAAGTKRPDGLAQADSAVDRPSLVERRMKVLDAAKVEPFSAGPKDSAATADFDVLKPESVLASRLGRENAAISTVPRFLTLVVEIVVPPSPSNRNDNSEPPPRPPARRPGRMRS